MRRKSAFREHFTKTILGILISLMAFAASTEASEKCQIEESVIFSIAQVEGAFHLDRANEIWQEVFSTVVRPTPQNPQGWPGPETKIKLLRCQFNPKLFLFAIISKEKLSGDTQANWLPGQFNFYRVYDGYAYGAIAGFTQLFRNDSLFKYFAVLDGPKLTSFTKDFWIDRDDVHFPSPFKNIKFGITFAEVPERNPELSDTGLEAAIGLLVIRDDVSRQVLNYLPLHPKRTTLDREEISLFVK